MKEYKNKKTKFFPSDLAEKGFAREWTKACGKIKRASGNGYIYKPISGCGMYEKGE